MLLIIAVVLPTNGKSSGIIGVFVTALLEEEVVVVVVVVVVVDDGVLLPFTLLG